MYVDTLRIYGFNINIATQGDLQEIQLDQVNQARPAQENNTFYF